jgi:hypothetical protein
MALGLQALKPKIHVNYKPGWYLTEKHFAYITEDNW